MVTTTLMKRMRKLRALLDIRLGPGAATLSPSITRIHLTFARRINDGHMGPRKFWHTYLPRLKYHNPAIPMTVERTEDQEGPASITVFFANGGEGAEVSTGSTSTQTSAEAASDGARSDRTRSINMKHKKEGEILEEVLRICEGRQVTATPAEEEQLRELEGERQRSEEDRVKQAKVLKDRRRQQEILRQAKVSMDTQ